MRHLGHFVCIYGAVVDGYSSLMTNTIRQINMSERNERENGLVWGGSGMPKAFLNYFAVHIVTVRSFILYRLALVNGNAPLQGIAIHKENYTNLLCLETTIIKQRDVGGARRRRSSIWATRST